MALTDQQQTIAALKRSAEDALTWANRLRAEGHNVDKLCARAALLEALAKAMEKAEKAWRIADACVIGDEHPSFTTDATEVLVIPWSAP